MIQSSPLLRRLLLADTIFSGAGAMSFTLGAAILANLTELPETLSRETGLILILYTALVGWLAMRSAMPRAWIALVIAINGAWTIASIALLVSDAIHPNLFGEIVVVLQAAATGVLAELQYLGLRRSRGAIAA
ncbi:MAG: hypothetical protein ACRECL_14610 [Bradyrhizobium sp.]